MVFFCFFFDCFLSFDFLFSSVLSSLFELEPRLLKKSLNASRGAVAAPPSSSSPPEICPSISDKSPSIPGIPSILSINSDIWLFIFSSSSSDTPKLSIIWLIGAIPNSFAHDRQSPSLVVFPFSIFVMKKTAGFFLHFAHNVITFFLSIYLKTVLPPKIHNFWSYYTISI